MRFRLPFKRNVAGDRPLDPTIFSEWGVIKLVRPCEGDPEETERVRAAMENLPKQYQDILNGIFYENLSKTALAVRLDVSRHDVTRRLRSALIALRDELGGMQHERRNNR